MITAKSALTIKSGFTREDLRQISGEGDGWRLSLYMPLYRTGREVRQAPILLKDLRSRASAELEGRGCDAATLDRLLEPINGIYSETDFTLLQGEGMAVLSSRGYSASFLMPIAPPAIVETGRRFLLDPLLPLLFENGRFYLLAFSLNTVRLYQADRLGMREISLDGMATNMREALLIDDTESYTMQHGSGPISGRAGSNGAGKAGGAGFFNVHGGGGGDVKERKREILEFFRQIDKGIRERLTEPDLPLMLAGVESLVPIYREANSHPGLMERAVLGSVGPAIRQEDLHAKAWKQYRQLREAEKKGILRLYGERLASPEAVSGIEDVLWAAWEKRILHLFLRRGHRQWGAFDPDSRKIDLDAGPGREDLVNLACIQALLGGAKVFSVEAGEIPERADIAALCRY